MSQLGQSPAVATWCLTRFADLQTCQISTAWVGCISPHRSVEDDAKTIAASPTLASIAARFFLCMPHDRPDPWSGRVSCTKVLLSTPPNTERSRRSTNDYGAGPTGTTRIASECLAPRRATSRPEVDRKAPPVAPPNKPLHSDEARAYARVLAGERQTRWANLNVSRRGAREYDKTTSAPPDGDLERRLDNS